MEIQLLKAKVWHLRERPKKNEFTYPVYYVSVPVTEGLIRSPRLFSFDAFNILSLYRKDHGARKDEVGWYSWAKEIFAKEGRPLQEGDTIELITHPRLFGYAFNPISFFLLFDAGRKLRAVICEVSNTFGEHHNYVLTRDDGEAIEPRDVFTAGKDMYVSPFTKMEGYYTFRFKHSDGGFTADIVYWKEDDWVLKTSMSGKYGALSSGTILSLLVRYPFMTFMVIMRIHWQAVKLWWKRVRFTLSERPTDRGAGVQTTSGQEKRNG